MIWWSHGTWERTLKLVCLGENGREDGREWRWVCNLRWKIEQYHSLDSGRMWELYDMHHLYSHVATAIHAVNGFCNSECSALKSSSSCGDLAAQGLRARHWCALPWSERRGKMRSPWFDGIVILKEFERCVEIMIVALYKKIHTKKTSEVVVLSVPAVLSHSNNIQRCTSRIYTETLCIPRYKKCQCVWGKRNEPPTPGLNSDQRWLPNGWDQSHPQWGLAAADDWWWWWQRVCLMGASWFHCGKSPVSSLSEIWGALGGVFVGNPGQMTLCCKSTTIKETFCSAKWRLKWIRETTVLFLFCNKEISLYMSFFAIHHPPKNQQTNHNHDTTTTTTTTTTEIYCNLISFHRACFAFWAGFETHGLAGGIWRWWVGWPLNCWSGEKWIVLLDETRGK